MNKAEGLTPRGDIECPYLRKILIESKPPAGKCRVLNIYIDPVTGNCVIEYDDTPQP